MKKFGERIEAWKHKVETWKLKIQEKRPRLRKKIKWPTRVQLRRTGKPSTKRAEMPEIGTTVEPNMQALTNQLIREMVGKDGVLTKEFEKRIAVYNTEETPLGEKEARAMIISLLKLAVSGRKLINERIERSLEEGEIFDSYYGRIHAVSAMVVDTNTKLKLMEDAKKDYEFHHEKMLRIRDKTYRDGFKPPYTDPRENPEQERDLLKMIDAAGGN